MDSSGWILCILSVSLLLCDAAPRTLSKAWKQYSLIGSESTIVGILVFYWVIPMLVGLSIPHPGISVLLIGVSAGIMSLHPEMKSGHQAIWVGILCVFAYMEIQSINFDVVHHDQEQREEQSERQVEFHATIRRLDSTIQLLNRQDDNIVLLTKRPIGGAVVQLSKGDLRDRALTLSHDILSQLIEFEANPNTPITDRIRFESNIFRVMFLPKVRDMRDEFAQLHFREEPLDQILDSISRDDSLSEQAGSRKLPITHWVISEIAHDLTKLASRLN